MYYIDTETCGFHGPAVLIQWAVDDGEIHLHEVFCEPIEDTLELIERIANHEEGVCGFNWAYDWFHLVKIYTMLSELGNVVGFDKEPRDYIEELAMVEPKARDGLCLKPVTALDLMLVARKGPYQSTMDRKEIRIRRVPKKLSFLLAKELERRVPIPDIYFARSKMTGAKWKIMPINNVQTGKEDEHFVDIVLKFSPSSALKALVIDAGLRDARTRLMYDDVAAEPKPMEVGWAPFALAISTPENDWFVQAGEKKGFAWPKVVMEHVYHWRFHEDARKYAADDVEDLRMLRKFFGNPEPGDDDSILACMVGATRWRGFKIDEARIDELIAKEKAVIKKAPRAPNQVYRWLTELMDATERESLKKDGVPSTEKVVLESITKMKKTCSCVKETLVYEQAEEYADFGEVVARKKISRVVDPDCPICKGEGVIPHPAAERAELVLESRKGFTKKVLYDKLKQAGRLHPSASVIGSLSGRMSGRTEVADGKRSSSINSLGIQHDKEIRSAFPLAWEDHQLNGGDFDAYEITIADAAWDDPDLRAELLSCSLCGYQHTGDEYRSVTYCPSCKCGLTSCKTCKQQVAVKEDGEIVTPCSCASPKLGGVEGTFRKIHALFAMELFPGNTYDDVLSSRGSKNDLYDKGKRSLFGGVMYGGDENTLVKRVGIDIDIAREGRNRFFQRYKGVQKAQQDCYDDHCSMRQPGGIGKAVEWHEPKEYVESLTGFRRYFTLENRITKALFTLAESPPKPWLQLKIKVVRRDREQLIGNAVRSALFAAAFQIQAQCMRAALNHKIQSTGAILTKKLQREIWELQPSGATPWLVQLMNIHDEIMSPSIPSLAPKIESVVKAFIEKSKSLIPLIKMSWVSKMKSWAEK